MQIRNVYVGTPPLQCMVITTDGTKYPMSCVSTPLIDVPDNTSELIVRWKDQDYDMTKVWTAANGWLEMQDYEERRKFAEEKRQFEEDKKKFKARKERVKLDETQLDVKVTPPNEDDPTPVLE